MKLPAHRHIPVLASAAVFALAYAFGLAMYPHFGSLAVLRNLMVDNAFLAVAAAGATLVIILGGIDLSVGSVMAFTSISIAWLVELHGWHPAAACLLLLVVGGLFGAAQGAITLIEAGADTPQLAQAARIQQQGTGAGNAQEGKQCIDVEEIVDLVIALAQCRGKTGRIAYGFAQHADRTWQPGGCRRRICRGERRFDGGQRQLGYNVGLEFGTVQGMHIGRGAAG